MTKLDKKIHEQHAKRLAAIIDAQSQFAVHLTKQEFNNLLRIELNTLAEVEKKLTEDKFEEKLTSAVLVKKFNELTKAQFKLDEKFKYEDDGDLIDNINYLPKYCKNIFKVDIDDLVEGKKVKVETPTNTFKQQPEMDTEDAMDAATAFNMGAMGFSLDPHENPFILGKANAELGKKISTGEVYQYKTKPKQIPVIKIILAVLIGLTVLGLLLAGIFCFVTNGLQYKYLTSSKTEPTAIGYLRPITNGIFYLLAAGLGGYTEYLTVKTIVGFGKKNGNPNNIYSFSWPFYIAFICLVLLVSLLDLRVTWFFEKLDGFEGWVSKSGAQWIGYKGWGACVVGLASLAGLVLIATIIGIVKTPKIDKTKLNGLINQYVDDIIAKNGGMPSPITPKGADVQTPVDVKPSEPKKDDKPSTDSKPTEPKK